MKKEVCLHYASRYAIDETRLPPQVRTKLFQTFGCARKVYNLYTDYLYQELEKRNYQGGDGLLDLSFPEVTFWKKQYPYLKEVDSLSLANAKIAFQNAVKNYKEQHDHISYTKRAIRRNESGTEPLSFRGLKGMPKFRSKAKGDFSYTTNCQYPSASNKRKRPTIRLEKNLLFLPKLTAGIPLILHRPLPEGAVIKNVTVCMEPDGAFYASIGYEITTEMDLTISEAIHTGNTEFLSTLRFLGLDYSQPDFYVDSDGRKANCPPHAYRKQEEKIARLQKQLSHMQYQSRNWEKQKKKVAAAQAKARHQRKDYAHKQSRYLADHYDVIAVEDLDLRAMGGSLKLGKNLHDNGFGMFREFLSYKLEENGSCLVKIAKSYPSTKRCSDCGHVNPEVKLGVQEWVCPVCGEFHHRDENAAINIAGEGRRIFAQYFLQLEQEKAKTENRETALSNARKKPKKKETASDHAA